MYDCNEPFIMGSATTGRPSVTINVPAALIDPCKRLLPYFNRNVQAEAIVGIDRETAVSQEIMTVSGWTHKMIPLSSETWLSPKHVRGKLIGKIKRVKMFASAGKGKKRHRCVTDTVYVFADMDADCSIVLGTHATKRLKLK